jgi:phytoene synthase
MTSIILSWEDRLLARACAPLERQVAVPVVPADAGMLEQAYAYCTALTKKHSKTFYLASGLLPPEKRRAVRALYAFSRVTDDLADRRDGGGLRALEAWRQRALHDRPAEDDPIALAWADTRARYRIPDPYAHQLIDGVAQDFHKTRYTSFEDLAEYAYGVASTVGLMSMHIIGFSGEEAVPYAVKLGVALQLTNILRDVGEDWRAGRLYLPQDELAAFDLAEEDIARGRVTGRWRAFLRFQIERNRRFYAEALPGIAMLHGDGRFAIMAAAMLYRDILQDIEAYGGNVFTRRAYLGGWDKLRRLPRIWWQSRQRGPEDRSDPASSPCPGGLVEEAG